MLFTNKLLRDRPSLWHHTDPRVGKKKHETEWLKQSDTSVLAHRDDFSHVKKEDVKKKRIYYCRCSLNDFWINPQLCCLCVVTMNCISVCLCWQILQWEHRMRALDLYTFTMALQMVSTESLDRWICWASSTSAI